MEYSRRSSGSGSNKSYRPESHYSSDSGSETSDNSKHRSKRRRETSEIITDDKIKKIIKETEDAVNKLLDSPALDSLKRDKIYKKVKKEIKFFSQQAEYLTYLRAYDHDFNAK